MSTTLPEHIESEAALDEVMTRPRPVLVEYMRSLTSPLVILGAGGKMGPTLAILARRAAKPDLDIVAVSRFSDQSARDQLESRHIRTISTDLMQRDALAMLPDSANVIYLVGLKFGTTSNPANTWAANTLIPAHVAERYTNARIVALSTGNVYPLVPVRDGGSLESDLLTPLGEYANSCVARERMFEFFSRKNGTPVTLIRLSYALDLRYGVLVDIARKVFDGRPVDVTMGYVNVIWQGDANEMIVRSMALADTPPTALNLTGTIALPVRQLATQLGEFMERPAIITGEEAETALLSNTAKMSTHLGEPATPIETILRWTASWIMNGGRLLDKPTHFQARDGEY